jgi:flagellar assembly factor FliW
MQTAVDASSTNNLQNLLFPEGLPGFEAFREFVLLPTEMPGLFWLQSLQNHDLYFLVIHPGFVDRDYQIELDAETIDKLQIEAENDVILYAIVTVPEDFRKMTANLKAPLVINLRNGRARQYVLAETEYQTKHPVFPPEGQTK